MPNMGSTLKGEIKHKNQIDCSYCTPLLTTKGPHRHAITALTASTSSECRNWTYLENRFIQRAFYHPVNHRFNLEAKPQCLWLHVRCIHVLVWSGGHLKSNASNASVALMLSRAVTLILCAILDYSNDPISTSREQIKLQNVFPSQIVLLKKIKLKLNTKR